MTSCTIAPHSQCDYNRTICGENGTCVLLSFGVCICILASSALRNDLHSGSYRKGTTRKIAHLRLVCTQIVRQLYFARSSRLELLLRPVLRHNLTRVSIFMLLLRGTICELSLCSLLVQCVCDSWICTPIESSARTSRVVGVGLK